MLEFGIIQKYFAPLAPGGLDDDAALLRVPDGCELVISTDTYNAGTHFTEDMEPQHIAHKTFRAALSDLAAMGAYPLAYQMSIAFPEAPQEKWLAEFTAALVADQQRYKIFCSGGDTTSIKGLLSLSYTMIGTVQVGKAWRRSGAQAGDLIILTGPVGDAWLGLQVLLGEIPAAGCEKAVQQYFYPFPRFVTSEAARAAVHAAIDISDGPVADLGHMCRASGVSARVEAGALAFSDSVQAALASGHARIQDMLSGGDDYELLLAVAPEAAQQLMAALQDEGMSPQNIGAFTAGPGEVAVFDSSGAPLVFDKTGWAHF